MQTRHMGDFYDKIFWLDLKKLQFVRPLIRFQFLFRNILNESFPDTNTVVRRAKIKKMSRLTFNEQQSVKNRIDVFHFLFSVTSKNQWVETFWSYIPSKITLEQTVSY